MTQSVSASEDRLTLPHDASPNPIVGQTGPKILELGQLEIGTHVVAVQIDETHWELAIWDTRKLSITHALRVHFELYGPDDTGTQYSCRYASVWHDSSSFVGTAQLSLPHGVSLSVHDSWSISESTLQLSRRVSVTGDAAGGFLTAVLFSPKVPLSWRDVQIFAPGMIYGHSDYTAKAAIGSSANIAAGVRQIRIREDRLPAPVFGVYFNDGTSAAVLNAHPDAKTTAEDAETVTTGTLIDDGFHFAAMGGYEQGNYLSIGLWFPGTEGEVTYRGDTYPNGQLQGWRRRYHPIRNGFIQQYQVALRFAYDETFEQFYTRTWRWAWDRLSPTVFPHDINLVRHTLIEMLANRVDHIGNKAGVRIAWNATTGERVEKYPEAMMGFLGRNTDVAYYLLHEAAEKHDGQSKRYRELGIAVLDSFAAMPVTPPVAEGFSLQDGSLFNFEYLEESQGLIHLRALAEGCEAMLKAWHIEAQQGRRHHNWLRWCVNFADWLLAQQDPGGGFPRAWSLQSGITEPEPLDTCCNAVSYLVVLSRITNDHRYLDAALRAANANWEQGHYRSNFVGGTLDNPYVIDKEAGTLSLAAYLAVFEVTAEETWLHRAITAANFAETWIYCYNVPMADDAEDTFLHWKKGVPTIGLQLISTGHSLVDTYMAFDVVNYAKLHRYTQDPHYMEVATILLHNTKLMLALPGRAYDLAGPGWQQEHWSLAPRRGCGRHRYWLPWVACSHLEGIISLQEFDIALYEHVIAYDSKRTFANTHSTVDV